VEGQGWSSAGDARQVVGLRQNLEKAVLLFPEFGDPSEDFWPERFQIAKGFAEVIVQKKRSPFQVHYLFGPDLHLSQVIPAQAVVDWFAKTNKLTKPRSADRQLATMKHLSGITTLRNEFAKAMKNSTY
jgi:hypothetical protein